MRRSGEKAQGLAGNRPKANSRRVILMREWHRETGTRVFVLDEQGRILLVEMQDRRNGGAYWVLPGGGIEDGEHAADCAVREVREETGLSVAIDRLVYVTDSVEPGVPQLCYTFYFLAERVTGASPVIGTDPERPPEEREVSAARFFGRDELAGLPRVYPEVLRDEFWRLLATEFRGHDPYRRCEAP
jgi:ADP-ribose pyrophosphatase YjhB (NUDIX family)